MGRVKEQLLQMDDDQIGKEGDCPKSKKNHYGDLKKSSKNIKNNITVLDE